MHLRILMRMKLRNMLKEPAPKRLENREIAGKILAIIKTMDVQRV